MSRLQYHLAQLNIGRIRAPLDSPIMSGFVERLDEINALADASPGFVWRLQTASGNATDVRAYDDDMLLVNLSVWKSVEALKHYVYKTSHAELLRGRTRWFEKFDGPYLVLWWIPAGHIPTVQEAKARLEHLRQNGPNRYAFTLKEVFEPVQQPALT